MRRASSLVVLAGCNQVFGSSEVSRFDAQIFDAVDAATSCPAGAPSFSRDFDQLVVVTCDSLTVAGEMMLGLCGTGANRGVRYGPIGSDLVDQPDLLLNTQFQPRLSHDGQRVSFGLTDMQGTTFYVFHLAGASWVRDANIVTDVAMSHTASEISNGPNARVLVQLGDGVHEFSERNGWVDLGLTSLTLTPFAVDELHLSADALRAWYFTSPEVDYFDRADLASAFTPHGKIGGTNGILDLAMREDCGEIFFSASNRIWTSQRI